MKSGLVLEQHLEIAQKLCPAQEFFMRLLCKLSKAYSHQRKVVRLAARVNTAIDNLKCELDNRIFQETPELCDNIGQIYYGADNEYRQGKVSIEPKGESK